MEFGYLFFVCWEERKGLLVAVGVGCVIDITEWDGIGIGIDGLGKRSDGK